MFRPSFNFNARRARHHRLFAKGAPCACVRTAHRHLAAVYDALMTVTAEQLEA